MVYQNIASVATIKAILATADAKPNKALGQNFLASAQVAEKILQAAQITATDNVLEIGPGLGALSEPLAAQAAELCLVELDACWCEHLQQLFAGQPQIRLYQADALRFDYQAVVAELGWNSYKLVANLPYHITSPLIKRLLLDGGAWQSLTLMMQKEVAQKLVAGQAGPLSLLLEYYGTAQQALNVPPSAFFPPPEVQSAVLQIKRHNTPPLPKANPQALAKLLWAAFGQRRKTLLNSLAGSYLGGDKALWQQALLAAAIDPNYRAEQLSLTDFGRLLQQPQVTGLLTTE